MYFFPSVRRAQTTRNTGGAPERLCRGRLRARNAEIRRSRFKNIYVHVIRGRRLTAAGFLSLSRSSVGQGNRCSHGGEGQTDGDRNDKYTSVIFLTADSGRPVQKCNSYDLSAEYLHTTRL